MYEPLNIEIQLLDPSLPLPKKGRTIDIGYDLVARETVEIKARMRATIPTGIAISLPVGVAGLIVPRSGLAKKHGLSFTNSPGLIDPGYTGEIQILAELHSDDDLVIEKHQRCAQLVLMPAFSANWNTVETLQDSERGQGGFGSSGTK